MATTTAMRDRRRLSFLLALVPVVIALQGCAFYAAYGALRVIAEVNSTLEMVENSMRAIQSVLEEGNRIHRAARDGELVAALAERIPGMVQDRLEQAVTEKINRLSGNLKAAALEFVVEAVAEDLRGALGAYNRMTDTFNRFSELMDDLSREIPPAPRQKVETGASEAPHP